MGPNFESGYRNVSPGFPEKKLEPSPALQDLTRKAENIKLYGYYFGTVGVSTSMLLLSSMITYALFLGLMPYWLRQWAESGGQYIRYYTGPYFLFTCGAFVSITVTLASIFLAIAPKAGSVLHNRLLHTVMTAPQSCFSTTDTGTTLNRFSSDILMIGRRLPAFLFQAGQAFFLLLSQLIVLGVVQPLAALALPMTLLVAYFVQRFYLATSRQLRHLDLETKAALNASFLETLEGVTRIRAFGWQRAFVRDNVRKLDMSLRPWYLMMCLQRWLNIVMDLIVLGIALLIISIGVAYKDTVEIVVQSRFIEEHCMSRDRVEG